MEQENLKKDLLELDKQIYELKMEKAEISIKRIVIDFWDKLKDIYVRSQKIGKEKLVMIYLDEANKIKLTKERTGNGNAVKPKICDFENKIGSYHTHLGYPISIISSQDILSGLIGNHLITCIGDIFGITFYIYNFKNTQKLREEIKNTIEYLNHCVSIAILVKNIEDLGKLNRIIEETKESYYKLIENSIDQIIEKRILIRWEKVLS